MIALSVLLGLLAVFCVVAAIALNASISRLRDEVVERVDAARLEASTGDNLNASEAIERSTRLRSDMANYVVDIRGRQANLAGALGYSWHTEQSYGKYVKDKKVK